MAATCYETGKSTFPWHCFSRGSLQIIRLIAASASPRLSFSLKWLCLCKEHRPGILVVWPSPHLLDHKSSGLLSQLSRRLPHKRHIWFPQLCHDPYPSILLFTVAPTSFSRGGLALLLTLISPYLRPIESRELG